MKKKCMLFLLGGTIMTQTLFSQQSNPVPDKMAIRNEIKALVYKAPDFKEPVDKEPNWKKINKEISKKYDLNADTLVNSVQFGWYNKKGDWEKYGKAFVAYLTYNPPSKFRSHIDMGGLNNALFEIAKKVKDKKVLLKAAELMDAVNARYVELYAVVLKNRGTAIDAKSSPAYAGSLDTQACLYYQGGQIEKALEIQQQAVSIAPDNKELQSNLKKMQSGEKLFL